MALGRVPLILFISLILRDGTTLSLDLEGLKEQAATHITGQKLNEIVSIPSLLAGTPVSPIPYLGLTLEYLITTCKSYHHHRASVLLQRDASSP